MRKLLGGDKVPLFSETQTIPLVGRVPGQPHRGNLRTRNTRVEQDFSPTMATDEAGRAVVTVRPGDRLAAQIAQGITAGSAQQFVLPEAESAPPGGYYVEGDDELAEIDAGFRYPFSIPEPGSRATGSKGGTLVPQQPTIDNTLPFLGVIPSRLPVHASGEAKRFGDLRPKTRLGKRALEFIRQQNQRRLNAGAGSLQELESPLFRETHFGPLLGPDDLIVKGKI